MAEHSLTVSHQDRLTSSTDEHPTSFTKSMLFQIPLRPWTDLDTLSADRPINSGLRCSSLSVFSASKSVEKCFSGPRNRPVLSSWRSCWARFCANQTITAAGVVDRCSCVQRSIGQK